MPELRAHTPTDDIQIKSNIPGKTSCRRRVQPDPVDYFQCDCTKLSLPDGYVAQTVTPRMHSDICETFVVVETSRELKLFSMLKMQLGF